MKLAPYPDISSAFDPRQEPYAVVPHVRICAGGGGQPPSLPRLCGCGYSNPDDEKYGCLAHQYAMDSLSEEHRAWLQTLSDGALIETSQGKLLLCHGSPDQTNEFLYESRLDNTRLEKWLEEYGAIGLGCTHTGIPWVRHLNDQRFAVNCGVVGKSDHDGDPAVHYALLRQIDYGFDVEIRRVVYDQETWALQLEAEGVDAIFINPIRTGVWTTGVASMPGGIRDIPQFSYSPKRLFLP